jgi:bla regulator protein BlaR1
LSRQRQMLQKLIADRFQLEIRHEYQERSIYALVVDKGGPKMKPNNDLKSAPAPLIRFTGRGRATAQIVSMSYVVQFLTSQVGRMVVDQTGLKGSYDFTLEWTPDPALEARGGGAPNGSPPAEGGPSIFTALREQLGLRLESTKGPIEFIVIDHVERASLN